METWTKMTALPGGANPCWNCPPIPAEAPEEKVICVGFGSSGLFKDGVQTVDGERLAEEGKFFTFKDAEDIAKSDQDHNWEVRLHGPLHGEVYQRRGPSKWVLVKRDEGFA